MKDQFPNYKEGDKITPNKEFPIVDGLPVVKQGEPYTCESFFYIKDMLCVYLKEITHITPEVILYKGVQYKDNRGSAGRICYRAIFFSKLETYPDMTAEIAKSFTEHPDTVDQPVKVLEVSN